MKLLKSKQNDFPNIYKEVPIKELDTKKPTTDLTELKKVVFLEGKYVQTGYIYWVLSEKNGVFVKNL